jgi:hypothetical protein
MPAKVSRFDPFNGIVATESPAFRHGEESRVEKNEHQLKTQIDMGIMGPSEPSLARVDGRVGGIGPL